MRRILDRQVPETDAIAFQLRLTLGGLGCASLDTLRAAQAKSLRSSDAPPQPPILNQLSAATCERRIMTNDIERHSPDEWRKTAAALMPESSSAGAEESAATAKVNANGAPLLGDSRDLFRPKTSDIPAKPGVYKWRDGQGRVIYVARPRTCAIGLPIISSHCICCIRAHRPWCLRHAVWSGRLLPLSWNR